MRVLDMDKKFRQLQAAGWHAYSDPVQFSFGPFVVKEWITLGPDGVSFALIERIKPRLEGWPKLREFSRTFNATQIVREMEPARRFYMNILGFKQYLYHNSPGKVPGPNVLGLPHNLTTAINREVWIVQPDGENSGSVELLAYDGLTGADFSARAVPPNLGLLALRFPVDNIKALEMHLYAHGVDIASPTAAIRLPYYQSRQLLAVRAPGGAWLEFFE